MNLDIFKIPLVSSASFTIESSYPCRSILSDFEEGQSQQSKKKRSTLKKGHTNNYVTPQAWWILKEFESVEELAADEGSSRKPRLMCQWLEEKMGSPVVSQPPQASGMPGHDSLLIFFASSPESLCEEMFSHRRKNLIWLCDFQSWLAVSRCTGMSPSSGPSAFPLPRLDFRTRKLSAVPSLNWSLLVWPQ